MVKIAVSSISPGGLDALIDHRFGRCEFFTIIEAENNQIKKIDIIENLGTQKAGGAGVLAAQTVANHNCQVVLTGRLGPNAYESLYRLGIKSFMAPIGSTVKSTVESYFNNSLTPMNSATAPPKSGVTTQGFGAGMGRGQGRGRR